MKVLLIDYLSPRGHIKFDKIHIRALAEEAGGIDVVGKKGHFPDFEEKDNISITSIPDCLFKKMPLKPLTERLLGLFRLLWINIHFHLTDYDVVIFLSYDVLSSFFFRKKEKVFMINHNNVSQLSNSIKLFLTRNLPSNYIHVALNKNMYDRLKELLPYKNIVYVPHGLDTDTLSVIRPSFINEGEKFMFCPVNRNYDREVLEELLNSKELNTYLETKSLSLYVKKNDITNSQLSRIRIIDGFLKDEEYNYMLTHSMAIVLPYGKDFVYRCSGIFFECVANRIPVLSTTISDMLVYKDDTIIEFFDAVSSFINSVENVMTLKEKNVNMDIFNPRMYWKNVLKGIA